MKKTSFIFLLLVLGIAAIAGLTALSRAPAPGTMMVRFLGLSAFFLLCASLLIGPTIIFFPSWGELAEPRRAVGISAFVFVLAHLLIVAALYFNLDIAMMATQVPIIIGAAAALILLALASTSSDMAVKTLGPKNWKLVQQFNYLAFLLSFIHFFLEIKGLHGGSIAPAEITMLALGVVVVILQIAGFLKRMTKKKAAEAAAAP